MNRDPAHPYIPNVAQPVREEMLRDIGVGSIDELYATIPERLRFRGRLNLPQPFRSEAELARHMDEMLSMNTSPNSYLSFLGYGCYPHYVPEVCSEINGRAEFLTAYAGEPYEDHGKWQAIFEYVSLMADLLEMDVVSVPTYDGYQAAATSLRMAGRISHRGHVLIASPIAPAKLAMIEAYLEGAMTLEVIPPDSTTGTVDLDLVARLVHADCAAVYLEMPNIGGVVEIAARELAQIAHDAGALMVCSVDPICLGFLAAPATWGADIVCGDIQSLGLGLHFGGANGGFIAVHDDERFVFELPSRLFGLAPTSRAGEIGFCDVAYERTSLAMRDEGVEWVGTAAALWGITAGVFLSLLGPTGLTDIGETVAARTRYAMNKFAAIPGAHVLHAASPHWREFVVKYDSISVQELNTQLRRIGIFGGVDLSSEFPEMGNASLYCVTETHTLEDIDRLVESVELILR